MRRPVVALFAMLALAGGCNDDDALPTWLAEQVEAIAAEPPANPPEQIIRYRFRGEVVYYRPPRCCDVPSEVYDSEGRVLCQPGGGITGRGDGRCPAFFETVSDCQVVWSDPRAKPGTLRGCAPRK